MSLKHFIFPALGALALLAGACVGSPSVDKVEAEIAASGACEALPPGVSCDCVVSTAHATIPSMKIERSKDDTGSRLGRGSIGSSADPRIPAAVSAAKQSCQAGKAVG